MKTQTEIVERIKEIKKDDFLSFEWPVYLDFLSFDYAEQFLKNLIKEKRWSGECKEPTKENILSAMLGYMSFAFEKANDCRGLSANRSIYHYEAWIWLLDDGFLEEFNKIEYRHYGKEKLISICEKYDWERKQWDNGIRTNTDD